MRKIKLFEHQNIDELEGMVNNWLEENNSQIKNVQYQHGNSSSQFGSRNYSVLISYHAV